MESFKINDLDIKEYVVNGVEVLIREIDRPLIIPKKRRKVEIPGRDYSWDFGGVSGAGEDLGDFPISIDLYILGKNSYSEALSSARNIGAVLVNQATLIFDEEPSLAYIVKIFDGVVLEREGSMGIRLLLEFECSEVSSLGS